MRLTKVALAVLQGAEIKAKIAIQEGVLEATVRAWVRNQHEKLTKASVIKIIKEETGLKEDQILEEELAVEPTK